MAAYVPFDFSSSDKRRSRPKAARIGPEPRLIRATPNLRSSGTVGEPGPAKMFTGQ